MYLSKQMAAPAGGSLGSSIGLVIKGCLGQNLGGHTGLRSVTLEHSGRFKPLTHMQLHPAQLLSLPSTDSAASRKVARYIADSFRTSRTFTNRSVQDQISILRPRARITTALVRNHPRGWSSMSSLPALNSCQPGLKPRNWAG